MLVPETDTGCAPVRQTGCTVITRILKLIEDGDEQVVEFFYSAGNRRIPFNVSPATGK